MFSPHILLESEATAMPQSAAQREATNRYRAKNGRKQINIELTNDDRSIWQNYADSLGLSCTAMVRHCVRRCMELDKAAEETHGASDV